MNQSDVVFPRSRAHDLHEVLEIARKLKEKTEPFVGEKPKPAHHDLVQEILPMSQRLQMPSNDDMPRRLLYSLGDTNDENTRVAHKLLAILNYKATLDSKPKLHVTSAKMRSLNRCAVREMVSV